MKNWFNKQSRLIQIILLLIPFVNWVVELLVRWSNFLEKKSVGSLLIAIIYTFLGLPLGWLDLIWVLLFKHLVFAK